MSAVCPHHPLIIPHISAIVISGRASSVEDKLSTNGPLAAWSVNEEIGSFISITENDPWLQFHVHPFSINCITFHGKQEGTIEVRAGSSPDLWNELVGKKLGGGRTEHHIRFIRRLVVSYFSIHVMGTRQLIVSKLAVNKKPEGSKYEVQ